jgi:hypothetical protein
MTDKRRHIAPGAYCRPRFTVRIERARAPAHASRQRCAPNEFWYATCSLLLRMDLHGLCDWTVDGDLIVNAI